MTNTGQLTQETFNPDPEYEEEWQVILNTGGKYTLGKFQARLLQQEIANGNRGIIPFKTFVVSIPYIAEFFLVKRFLKDSKQLSATASELPYKPIPKERWERIKKEAYARIGKKFEAKIAP